MESSKRILKEFREMTASPPHGTKVKLVDVNDLYKWEVLLPGPAATPFADATFELSLELPPEYPFRPPLVSFTTRIYHPNVTNDTLGNVCLGLLKPQNWKPSTKLTAVIEAVRDLLAEPQPDDALEGRIADEYRNDRPVWEHKAREMVEKHALTKPSDGLPKDGRNKKG